MNENELKFILRMRDEASSILAQHGEAMGALGSKAKNMKNDVNAASGSLMELARHAKEATEAVAALWTANEVAHKSLEMFREHERGMQVVARTTKIAGEAMVEFQANFDQMAAATKGASVNNLVEFAEVAGQLGIRGQADVLKFSETIGKLTQVTDIAGEEVAKQFGRLLLLTGEGAKGTQKLADSLSGLQATTKASAAEILMLGSQLAQTTAGFKLGADALTGLAAAAAQLNIQPYLLSNAVGRTLRELKDGALNATGGMKDLTTMLGTTREEFLALIQTNPDQALVRFLSVLRQIGASGGSVTGFLQKFQLQGAESQKVLLTLAQNVDEVKQKVQESKNLQSQGGSLDKAYEGFSKSLDADLKGLQSAWDLFAKNMGKALAPAVKEILTSFTGLLNGASNLMQAMPDLGQKFVAWSAVGVPALFGLQRVLSVFPGVMTTIQGGLVALGRQFGIMAGQATVAAAQTAEAEAAMSAGGVAGKAGGLTGKLGRGAGWLAAFGLAYEGGKEVANLLNEYAPDFANGVAKWRDDTWRKIAGPTEEEKRQIAIKATGMSAEELKNLHDMRMPSTSGGHDAVPGTPELPKPKPIFEATEANKQALERFDKYSKLVEDLKKAEAALQALREGSAKFGQGGDARTQAEIGAIERAIEAEKRALDPMNRLRDSWKDQLDAAQAVTKEEQNQAAIEKAIAEERRNNPRFTEADAGEIRTRMGAIQSAERRKSFDEEFNNLQKTIAAARALTAIDKERVEIDQQIADFVRQNGALTEEQERAMRRMLALQKETAEAASLDGTLNSQGRAIQNYERQVQLLERMHLSADAMARAMGQLNRETEAARNPLGAIATENEHELEALSRTGHYREAEVAALQQKYELQRKGVEVDEKMLADLTEYQKRLQDLKEAQTTGFGGWANKVKDVQGQLQDLAGEFSNDLSGAIVGALEGKRNAFEEAGRALGAAMIKMSVEGLMKQAYNALGLTDTSKQLKAAQEASDKLRADGEEQTKQAMTQTMEVQAGIVNIQGSPGGALTGGKTVDGLPVGVKSIAPSSEPPSLSDMGKLKQAMIDAQAPAAAAHVEAAKKTIAEAKPPSLPPLKPYNANESLESAYGPGFHGMFGDKVSDGISATDWRVKAFGGVDGGKIQDGTKEGLGRLKDVMGTGKAATGAAPAAAAGAASPFGDLEAAKNAFPSAPRPGTLAAYRATPHADPAMFAGHPNDPTQLDPQTLAYLQSHAAGGANVRGMDPVFAGNLAERMRGAEAAGFHPQILSGYRSPELQAKLYANYQARQAGQPIPYPQEGSGGLAARPGSSMHNYGRAADVYDPSIGNNWQRELEYRRLMEGGGVEGLKGKLIPKDPNHFQDSRGYPQVSSAQSFLRQNGVDMNPTGSIAGQGGSAMQNAVKQAQAAQEAMRQQMQTMTQSTTQNLTGLTSGIGEVGQKALSAVPSMGSFGSSIESLVGSLSKNLMGGMGGGGFGGIFSSLFSAMHTGGVVGVSPAMGMSRRVSPLAFAGAPRFHEGLTSDEFPAILQRGERVLTAQQDQRASALMGRMADMLQTGSAAGAGAPAPQRPQGPAPKITMNINTPNASSFRYSQSQIMAETSAQMSRASAKHN